MNNMKSLVPQHVIYDIVDNVYQQLMEILPKNEEIYFVCVLDGAYLFFTDLTTMFDADHDIRPVFMMCKSYENNIQTNKFTTYYLFDMDDLSGKTVVLIDDILDSGKTINHIMNEIKDYSPTSKIIPVTLFKREGSVELKDHIYGKMVDKGHYLVGYGLDDNGKYRHLLDIYSKEIV